MPTAREAPKRLSPALILREGDPPHLARAGIRQSIQQSRDEREQVLDGTAPGGQNNNRKWRPTEVLLKLQVLIRSDEGLKPV